MPLEEMYQDQVEHVLGETTILVVDDNQDNLDLMEALLLDDGYDDVICVNSGKLALTELDANEAIGLVLLDIMMPDVDGYQVCHSITSNPLLQHIPVIMVTGGALRQSEALEKSFKLGAMDYISKPVNEIELRWRVRSALVLYCERVIRRRKSDELAASEEKLRGLFENSMDEFAMIDPRSLRLTSVNDAIEKNSGYSRESLVGQDYTVLYHPSQRRVEASAMKALQRRGSVRYESLRTKITGAPYPVDVQVTRIGEPGSDVYFLVQRDISERKSHEEQMRQMSEQLSYQAAHDALTGLPNRREFENLLKQAIATATMEDQTHTLCYMDLDQFKIINDAHGHIAGDEILIQVAGLMRQRIRQSDTLARLGGDEFGLLLHGCDLDNAESIVQSMSDILNENAFQWEDKTFNISASFGLVAIHVNSGGVTELLSAADAACYAAKDLGRNRIQIYREDDGMLQVRHTEMQWVNGINRALNEKRFTLYAQPLMALGEGESREHHHWEILLRIIDEEGQLVSPAAFIPAAERFHIMPSIDKWVVPSALELIKAKLKSSTTNSPQKLFGLNLSGSVLGNDHTLRFIKDSVNESGIPPQCLCFEITETAVIQDLEKAIDFIKELREMGCQFALDDFGSGSSNFSYLKSLPVDYIKIDGMFIRGVVDDPLARTIVESINDIAHVIGVKTIAEFVENDQIIEVLEEIGIDYAQGYGIGKPIPFTDILE
ncbi:MAG: diguanylate cyclase (GGDEF)-like protein/PAS domain S-box-containing protein [Gammaproteobacteria bacterium]|jgi:diguanylate cyclase (GGDEF)-like protein/PAS domain S-box-containing protein